MAKDAHAAEVATLDITRSLRDRGKKKGTDRAAISYTKVDSKAPRTGRSRWTHIKSRSLDFDLIRNELMNLDMSDFRISLSLGHLRYSIDSSENYFTDGGRKSSSLFCCRGHHHDPVYDYSGMPGAYPIVIAFPYLERPAKKTSSKVEVNSSHPSLPLSISRIIFGSSDSDKEKAQMWTVGANPVNDYLDLVVPTFVAFIVDPFTIITLSPHDVEQLIGESLTVGTFAEIKPPEPFKENAEDPTGSQPNGSAEDAEIQITDATGRANKQYVLPRLPRRNWQTFLDIVDLVFREVPGREPAEISRRLTSEEYILVDEQGEIVTEKHWRYYYRQVRGNEKLHLRLMRKENWNLVWHPTVEKAAVEEIKGSTLKERKDAYLQMIKEREEQLEAAKARRQQEWEETRKRAQQQATVESDGDSDASYRPTGPSKREQLSRTARNRRRPQDGPMFEFFVADDPNVPTQLLGEGEVETDKRIEVQPALLWRGPPESATSSRAKLAAKTRAAARETALSKPPNGADMKLDEPFIKSLDKSFILDMPEYQRATLCTLDNFKEVLVSWNSRIAEAKAYEIDVDQSLGLRRLQLATTLWKLFVCFVPEEDESPLGQKYRASLVNLVKDETTLSIERLDSISKAIEGASTDMETLRAHLKNLYTYGRPNFYIPQSLLDAFALVLVLVFSLGEKIWPKDCSVKLDNALPVNISPFDRDFASFSDPGCLLDKSQDLGQSVVQGFRSAKMELLVGLMFRPELPVLTRTTTYEVADAEAILMLVIEHMTLSVNNDPAVDLIEDCKNGLTFLRHRSRKAPSRSLLRDIETQIDKLTIIIGKMNAMAWVAKRFAEEQQLKDTTEADEDNHFAPPPPRTYRRRNPFQQPPSNSFGEDVDVYYHSDSLYEVRREEHVRRHVPQPVGRDDGHRYHNDRYARDDDEFRSMKFGEEIGTRCLGQLKDRTRELDRLISELRQLSTQVVALVDIKAEDHGQAILTFTIVTIIFLPLSFVSSFFGMNTADIRGMDSSQTIFWYTSVPFTAMIVLATWLLTFKAKRLRELLSLGWLRVSVFAAEVKQKQRL